MSNAPQSRLRRRGNGAQRKFRVYPDGTSGFKIAVATNGGRPALDLVRAQMEICDFFEVLFSYEDVGQPKPSPKINLPTFHQLGLCARLTLERSEQELANRLTGAIRTPLLADPLRPRFH